MCLPIAPAAVSTLGGTMTDSYVYAIAALLPLAAFMLIFQTNPYHALVIRGILGAIAALVYTVLGAADVALTEALVGTLLAISLYAVAVRSSLVMRLGVLKDEIKHEASEKDDTGSTQVSHFKQLINDLQTIFSKRHMRVELIPYLDREDLHRALMDKEVHAICARSQLENKSQPYHTKIRLRRLYEIVQTELVSSTTCLTYVNTPDSREEH
jgi:putative multicomponent Na+:H+ antiporter subunit B